VTSHQSSKYTTTNFPMNGLKISFMRLIKVLGALDRPKGITSYSIQPILGPNLMIATSKVNFGKDLGSM